MAPRRRRRANQGPGTQIALCPCGTVTYTGTGLCGPCEARRARDDEQARRVALIQTPTPADQPALL